MTALAIFLLLYPYYHAPYVDVGGIKFFFPHMVLYRGGGAVREKDPNSLKNFRNSHFHTTWKNSTFFQLHFCQGELWGGPSQKMTELIFF